MTSNSQPIRDSSLPAPSDSSFKLSKQEQKKLKAKTNNPEDASLRLPVYPLLNHTPVTHLRSFCYEGPTLQVMDHDTVKERHLFLFNDSLVLAKPYRGNPNGFNSSQTSLAIPTSDSFFQDQGEQPCFQVKKLFHIRDISLTRLKTWDESIWAFPKRRGLKEAFQLFSEDPHQALHLLMTHHVIGPHPSEVAQFFHRHFTDLPPRSLGSFLGNMDHLPILMSFLEQFKFHGRPLSQSIRLFFRSFRIPTKKDEIDRLFRQFAEAWYESNAESLTFDVELTLKLVYATMNLDKTNHQKGRKGSSSTGRPSSVISYISTTDTTEAHSTSLITLDKFVQKIRSKDPHGLIPASMLEELYHDVNGEKIGMGVSEAVRATQLHFESSSFPVRLTAGTVSDWISISCPNVDPHFKIHILTTGSDLTSEPEILDFSQSSVQKFRLKSSGSVGYKMVMFLNSGVHARKYLVIPSRVISLERKFMQNVFQLMVKEQGWTWKLEKQKQESVVHSRRYLFSVESKEKKRHWMGELGRVIKENRRAKSQRKGKAAESGEESQDEGVGDYPHIPGFSQNSLPRQTPRDHRNLPLPLPTSAQSSHTPLEGLESGNRIRTLADEISFQTLQHFILVPSAQSLASTNYQQTIDETKKSELFEHLAATVPPRIFTNTELVRTVLQSCLIGPAIALIHSLLKNPGQTIASIQITPSTPQEDVLLEPSTRNPNSKSSSDPQYSRPSLSNLRIPSKATTSHFSPIPEVLSAGLSATDSMLSQQTHYGSPTTPLLTPMADWIGKRNHHEKEKEPHSGHQGPSTEIRHHKEKRRHSFLSVDSSLKWAEEINLTPIEVVFSPATQEFLKEGADEVNHEDMDKEIRQLEQEVKLLSTDDTSSIVSRQEDFNVKDHLQEPPSPVSRPTLAINKPGNVKEIELALASPWSPLSFYSDRTADSTANASTNGAAEGHTKNDKASPYVSLQELSINTEVISKKDTKSNLSSQSSRLSSEIAKLLQDSLHNFADDNEDNDLDISGLCGSN